MTTLTLAVHKCKVWAAPTTNVLTTQLPICYPLAQTWLLQWYPPLGITLVRTLLGKVGLLGAVSTHGQP